MRRLLRDLGSALILLLVLGPLALFAWASHHPDDPRVRRAEAWPVVGGWVVKLRRGYTGPGAADRATGREGRFDGGVDVEVIYEPIDEPGGAMGPAPGAAVGAPPAPSETVWLLPGQAVHAAPSADSEITARVTTYRVAGVLESSGEWVRVTSPEASGWVHRLEREGPPLGNQPAPNLALPGRSPEAEKLAAAEELLGVEAPALRLGPYPLYTDVPQPERLVHLARLAGEVEGVYRRRYGLDPLGEAHEAVALFADEATYRRFQRRERSLAGLPSGGHSGGGMASLYLGDRRRDEVMSTLVHELTHLLDRRAIGPALPPWLDEGIADDMAYSYISDAGDLDPRRLGGSYTMQREGEMRVQIRYFGALGALRNLDHAFETASQTPLSRLLALDWDAFVRSDERGLHYAEAAFFVRYLIAGEGGRYAPAFRRFLAAAAAGGAISGEALRAETGRSWSELEQGLAAWVAAEVEATEPEVQPPSPEG